MEPLKKELLYKIKGGVRFPERVAMVGNEKNLTLKPHCKRNEGAYRLTNQEFFLAFARGNSILLHSTSALHPFTLFQV